MSVWQTVLGIASPVLVAAGTTVGVMVSRRTGAEANRTADWEKFTARMESWTERELTAQTSRINGLEETVSEIREDRDRFRNEAVRFRDDRDELRHKYDAAVAYLRWLTRELQRVLPDADIRPPPEIASDL